VLAERARNQEILNETQRPPGRSLQYRADIDGLRAIAVIAVVAFHAFPSQVEGGFVGVDIFFVISGYLISTIILGELKAGRFSIIRFYSRRIRRIFPALLLVLSVSYAFGWFTLLADEFKQLGDHIAGGAGFFSNFAFWSESGYFDNSAETKPLLHLWSLGIEEQFYIVWPFLIGIAYRCKIKPAVVVLLLGGSSFALNIAYVSRHDLVGAFYAPQTRVWELLIGALLACLIFEKQTDEGLLPGGPIRNLLAFVGIAFIGFAVFQVSRDTEFPGFWALAPTLGTALLIAAGPEAWLNRRVFSTPALTWVGLISFPLYLWHWPLLTFPRMIQGAPLSVGTRIAAVVTAVLLAWLTYVLIERPVRSRKSNRWPPVLAAVLMVGVGSAGFLTSKADGVPRRAHLVAAKEVNSLLEGSHWVYTTNGTCKERYPAEFRDFCMQEAPGDPTLILLGDSYANQFYGGLVNSDRLKKQNVVSYGSCTAPVLTSNENARKNCELQLRIVDTTPSIKFAIISSRWPRFDSLGRYSEHFSGSAARDTPGDATRYMVWLEGQIEFLTARGVRVIIFGPKPEFPYDIRQCFARPLKSSVETCRIPVAEATERQASFRDLSSRILSRHPEVLYFDQNPLFCGDSTCSAVKRGLPLLRDARHYSRVGSDAIIDRFVRWAEDSVPEILDR
jgi:peptidoglycan/LPS O-acetylase OafA/YrhL